MKVTTQNYEEHVLDWLEGTLSPDEVEAFERFLEAHPEIGKEIRALREEMPVVVPDSEVRFPDKSTLKRKIPMRRLGLRIAAVAAALLAGMLIINRFLPENASSEEIDPNSRILAEKATGSANETVSGTESRVGEGTENQVDIGSETSVLDKKTDLLADAAPAPASTGTPVKTPERKVQPTVEPGSGGKLKANAASVVPAGNRTHVQAGQSQANESPETTGTQDQILEIREVIAAVPPMESWPESVSEIVPEPILESASEDVRLAQASDARMDFTNDERFPPMADETLSTRSTRDYFDENDNQQGLLRSVNRKGIRRLASGILTPLSELSPIKVYETNEERVVEFASIPISRKSNKTQY